MDLADLFQTLKVEGIDAFIKSQQEEHLALEFKTVNRSDLGAREDRKNFAIALSGFANSDGGLIIWGVHARKNFEGVDCACARAEIEDLTMFLSRLNEFTGQLVRPIIEGISHRKIETSPGRGFAVTLVPASDAGPHMAVAPVARYYKRSGDSFYKMEHFDIEDMFGRRKKPQLTIRSSVERESRGSELGVRIVISIENLGRGSACAPFLFLKLREPFRFSGNGLSGNDREHTGLPRVRGRGHPSKVGRYGGDASRVIHPGTILDIDLVKGSFRTRPEATSRAIADYEIAAQDMRAVKGELEISTAELVGDHFGTE